MFDDFVSQFIERAKKIKVGDPTNDETKLGPLASLSQVHKVLSFVKTARANGGSLCPEDLGLRN